MCCGVLLFTFWLYGQRIIIKSSKKCKLIHPLAKYLISFDFILPLAVPCVVPFLTQSQFESVLVSVSVSANCEPSPNASHNLKCS